LVLQVFDRNAAIKPKPGEHADIQTIDGANRSTDDLDVRIGFTVTRKVGGAVVRNRTKRRLRAAVETVMPTHAAPGRDYVVIGRARTNARPFSELVGDLVTAMQKLNAWHDVGTTTNGRGHDKEHRNE
jgi:ribonuclease P protein component